MRAAVIIVSLLGGCIFFSGLAQGEVTAAKGGVEEWTKLCFEVTASVTAENKQPSKACYTYIVVRDPPTQIDIARLGVLQVQPSGRSILLAFLPLGSVLPQPMYIILDGEEEIQLGYFLPSVCDIYGCPQRALLTADLLERLGRARSISLGVREVLGHELSIPVPCCDFKAVFENTAATASHKDEYSKIIEILSQYLGDFMRKDWEKLCFSANSVYKNKGVEIYPDHATGEICYTYTEVRDSRPGPPLAFIGVLEAKASKRIALATLLLNSSKSPLDPGQLQINWEPYFLGYANLNLVNVPPEVCDPNCYARAMMPEAILDALKAANYITFRQLEGVERRYLLPCCSFKSVWEGSPVAPEDKNETQLAIQKRLQRHLTEIISD